VTSEETAPGRIGVYGGTFDPPHVGHLIAAAELRHVLKLDRLLFVPAGRPPHKEHGGVGRDADRVAMVRLAIAGNPAFEVSSVDLDGGGPSFTADLLARLREELAPAELVFLMGGDSLRDLPGWHGPGRIAELAELGVATRPGVEVDVAAVERAVPQTRGRIRVVEVPAIGVSSSDIRRRVAADQPIAYQVPAAVERYIRDHGLYRA
jgi:nicotinate-nucleotide adenylyltransferase